MEINSEDEFGGEGAKNGSYLKRVVAKPPLPASFSASGEFSAANRICITLKIAATTSTLEQPGMRIDATTTNSSIVLRSSLSFSPGGR